MSEKFFNNMLSIIIGDNNSDFDGHNEMIKREIGDYHHVMAYEKAISLLKEKGYDLTQFLGNENRNEISEFIKAGHILMLNVSQNNNTQGVVYLPNKLTKKQLEEFSKFANEFRGTNSLFVTLNDENSLDFNKFHDNKIKNRIKKNR